MMRRIALALPLLLSACAGWPSGSYSSVSEEDAKLLAPDIASYLTHTMPSGTAVALVPAKSGDPIASLLGPELDRAGMTQEPTGLRIQYIAAPLDKGVLLRISIDNREGGSRYYARASNGILYPDGPTTVAQP